MINFILTGSFSHRAGIIGRNRFTQTANRISSKSGSLGTTSWYGKAYGSTIEFLPPVMHLLQVSQSTRPTEYISAILKASKEDVFKVSSKTSGAMYRRVPTRVLGAISISPLSLKIKNVTINIISM